MKLGKVFYYRGDYKSSLDILTDYEEFESSPQKVDDAIRCYYAGLALSKLYNYEESLSQYFKSLNIIKEMDTNDTRIEGLIYCDIGNIYYYEGNYSKALKYYEVSRKLLSNQNSPDYSKISILINNIGSILFRLEDYSSALKSYKEAIKIQKKYDVDFFDLSMYQNNIAGIYLLNNEIDSAKKYYVESLKIRKEILRNNNLVIQSLNQLGILYYIQCDYIKSVKLFHEAIILNTPHSADTSVFSNPNIYTALDYRTLGLSLYYKALAFYKIYLLKDHNSQLYFNEACQAFHLLLEYFEHLYINHINERNYEYYIPFNREVLNTIVDVLNENGDLSSEDLFALIEKGKSIYLYQSIIKSNAKEFSEVPPSLLKEENDTRMAISDNNIQILIAQNDSIDISNSQKFSKIINHRESLYHKLDSIINIYDRQFPNYYHLKYDFSTISPTQLQDIITPNECIVEYFMSDSLLYTILVSKQSVFVHTQKTDSIEHLIEKHLRGIKFFNNNQVKESGKQLYKILILPLSKEIKKYNIEKIIIIPDHGLVSLPFETLIIDDDIDNEFFHYLILDYYLVYQFSSSLWYYNRANKVSSTEFHTNNLLAIAPVFSPKDFSGSDNAEAATPLYHSEEEIILIKKLFEDKGLENRILLHTSATKSDFIENSSDYSIIHISTHGFYNKDQPELSGVLFYGNSDSTHINNMIVPLYIEETYTLSLQAELVVLNACMTGRGKDLFGEGLATMYRGFFYSGANNILFTLWDVSDYHASEFMILLYSKILEGCSYSAALRETKISFIKNSGTSLPFFWSNYLILGN